MTGYNRKSGAYMTKEDKRMDAIKGAKKYLAVGNFEMVYLKEKELMTEYGMTAQEVEDAIYS